MKQAYFKYVAALLLFGSNGIVASKIGLSSYEIVFTRTLIGSLFLISTFAALRQKARFRENRAPNWAHFGYLAVSGAAMGASWMFLYEAYTRIGVSTATLAYYSGPVIVLVLSPLLFKEKLTAARLLGFLAVLGGMYLVNARALAEGSASWGLLFGVLAAVMYAFMVIFNKKAASIGGLENAMWQLIISFVTVAVFVGLKQGFTMQIPPGSLPPILLLGVVNTGLGCYLYFSSIGGLPAQSVAVFGYLEPLSALAFSAVLLGESLSFGQVVGAALILGGAALGELFVHLLSDPPGGGLRRRFRPAGRLG